MTLTSSSLRSFKDSASRTLGFRYPSSRRARASRLSARSRCLGTFLSSTWPLPAVLLRATRCVKKPSLIWPVGDWAVTQVQLPLDDDGFLRRECPHCLQQFKWHQGPTADRPDDETDPPVYYCPRCGGSAKPDQWWTEAQLTFIQESIAGPALGELSDEMEKAFQGVKGLTYRAWTA